MWFRGCTFCIVNYLRCEDYGGTAVAIGVMSIEEVTGPHPQDHKLRSLDLSKPTGSMPFILPTTSHEDAQMARANPCEASGTHRCCSKLRDIQLSSGPLPTSLHDSGCLD